jgi:hypothetical protein
MNPFVWGWLWGYVIGVGITLFIVGCIFELKIKGQPRPGGRELGEMAKWECTASFQGEDGLGTCNERCTWYHKEGCPAAKGSQKWDGKQAHEPRV